jgi:hypothetical protein
MDVHRKLKFDVIALEELERRLDEALKEGRSADVWPLVNAIEELDRDHVF